MKASELISYLGELITEHGDLCVIATSPISPDFTTVEPNDENIAIYDTDEMDSRECNVTTDKHIRIGI